MDLSEYALIPSFCAVTANSRINASTLEEIFNHTALDFPYTTDLCSPHTYPGGIFPWHWHKEVEFFYIRKGTMEYILPTGTYSFCQGEGGFINSGIPHMTRCIQNHICVQEEHLFLPVFIGGQESSILMNRYIRPILTHPNLDLYRFDSTSSRQEDIIPLMQESYDYFCLKKEGYEFDVRESMTKLWRILFSLSKEVQTGRKKRPQSDRIKTMMAFISSHYQEKLTLKQRV